MPTITLPDKSQREYDDALTVMQVSESIGPGLAKATLGGLVDDQVVDASFLIEKDSNLRIITERDPEGLEIIRHSCAHLMAQAVKELYPEAQVTIGPVIEDGFYYDYAYEPGFTPEDLVKIEKKMQELSKANLEVTRSVKTRDEATAFFRELGEEYKAQIIESIPNNEELSLYTQGDFTDLCRGPHVPSTGKIKSFKLMKLAGAYWRGDSNNEMLQRIYGTAWQDKNVIIVNWPRNRICSIFRKKRQEWSFGIRRVGRSIKSSNAISVQKWMCMATKRSKHRKLSIKAYGNVPDIGTNSGMICLRQVQRTVTMR
ncbi:MAG: threonyl-tRNA synthetase [Planctomycetota bacterium]|jgi:threonyl-tRNA synthetase